MLPGATLRYIFFAVGENPFSRHPLAAAGRQARTRTHTQTHKLIATRIISPFTWSYIFEWLTEDVYALQAVKRNDRSPTPDFF